MARTEQDKANKILKDFSNKSKKESSNSSFALGISVVAIIAVVMFGVIFYSIKSNNDAIRSLSSYSEINTDTGKSEMDMSATFTVGSNNAKKSIDVFQDAICPICGDLERKRGPEIEKYVFSGELKVRYHFLYFMDQYSKSQNYSTRVAKILTALEKNLYANDKNDSSVLKKSKILLEFQKKLYSPGFLPPETREWDHDNETVIQEALKVVKNSNEPSVYSNNFELFEKKFRASINTQDTEKTIKTKSDLSTEILKVASGNSSSIGTPSIIKDGELLQDPSRDDLV